MDLWVNTRDTMRADGKEPPDRARGGPGSGAYSGYSGGAGYSGPSAVFPHPQYFVGEPTPQVGSNCKTWYANEFQVSYESWPQTRSISYQALQSSVLGMPPQRTWPRVCLGRARGGRGLRRGCAPLAPCPRGVRLRHTHSPLLVARQARR